MTDKFCDQCDGSGADRRTREVCTKCKGSGRLRENESNLIKTDCPFCHGAKERKGITCAWCKGAGYVYEPKKKN